MNKCFAGIDHWNFTHPLKHPNSHPTTRTGKTNTPPRRRFISASNLFQSIQINFYDIRIHFLRWPARYYSVCARQQDAGKFQTLVMIWILWAPPAQLSNSKRWRLPTPIFVFLLLL